MENIEFDEYGTKICDEVMNGTHNVVVEACAGAGKTTLIVHCAKNLPSNKRILMVAFNKGIEKDLANRINHDEYPNIRISTLHGLGYRIIKENHIRFTPHLNEYKYRIYTKQFVDDNHLCKFRKYSLNYEIFCENIIRLIDYARFNLKTELGEIPSIAKKYNVNLLDNECEIAYHILEWGKDHIEEIDFGDMIWIPIVLGYSTKKYKADFIFIDEAQDTSVAQQALLRKTFDDGARFLAAGERPQCINAWNGGDADAFKKYIDTPNTVYLTLPVSRRCPQKVVEYAQKYNPAILPSPMAVEGEVNFNVKPSLPSNGDMVLCRNVAPLMKYYNYLVSNNKTPYLKGTEGCDTFKTLLMSTSSEELNADLNNYGVFTELFTQMFSTIDAIATANSLERREVMLSSEITDLYDKICALQILAVGLKTKTELLAKITDVFPNEEKIKKEKKIEDGISLSTVHKAKGLESDNIYILGDSLMPSKLAKQEWEMEAEVNLQYVAYTRAKKTLNFIDEDEFSVDNAFKHPEHMLNVLSELETKLKYVSQYKRQRKTFKYTGDTEEKKTNIPPKKIGGNKYKMFM